MSIVGKVTLTCDVAIELNHADSTMKSTHSVDRTKQAAIYEREALRHDVAARYNTGRQGDDRWRAEQYREKARELMTPGAPAVRCTGGEVVPDQALCERMDADNPLRETGALVRNTLRHPDVANLQASAERLEALEQADALALGLDIADSIDAQNSLERCLAHQMAALHNLSMKFISDANNPRITNPGHPQYGLDAVRAANTAAKLMKAFQEGATTLQKLRTGGRQEVVVQHVQVGEGGQAVVAGRLEPGEAGARVAGGRSERPDGPRVMEAEE